jgi:hypothetical protein
MRGMSSIRLLLALVGAMAVSQVFAQTLPASVIACADETDVLKRLSCYDREVARYRTRESVAGAAALAPGSSGGAASGMPAGADARPSPGPPAPGASGTGSPAEQQAEFGMNSELKRKEQGPGATEPVKLDKITAKIASLSYKPHGESLLTLDDGQIWEEAENESHVPYHVGDEVTIKRGVLGAFYLSTPAVRGMRVKRVH